VSILSDQLLRSLMAVGEVDVLVGLPTLNHADTVGSSVRAVQVAFHRELARERTLFLNVDGGSTDGTAEAVRDAAAVEREVVLASQSLRTRHRISTPYHGVPGKAGALRTLFAAADLLHARVVVVLDPEVTSVSPEGVAALARPVLSGEAQFTSPAYARHPLDGPLVTQLVRPLFRSAYGLPLREPLASELACSDRFAAVCLERSDWESTELRTGIDLWLATVAALGPFRVAEVHLGPRQMASRPRPPLSTLLPQVLQALFRFMTDDERVWPHRDTPDPVALHRGASENPAPPGPLDLAEFARAFRDGVDALAPILAGALERETLAQLCAAGASPLPRVSDPLWTETVCELAAAYRSGRVSHEHLLQASVPLYLGRVAAFAGECAALPVEAVESRLEQLALHFERSKPRLVELWTAAMR